MPGIDFQAVLQGMAQNPEFQTTIQKLAKLPKSVQALINQGPTTEKFATDTAENMLLSDKIGAAARNAEQDRNLTKLRYGLSLNNANNALALKGSNIDMQKSADKLSNRAGKIGLATGLINVGLSGYGAYNSAQHNNALLDYYLNKIKNENKPII